MKIKCINSGDNKLITVGNEYEILNETENRYSILNNKGIQKNYGKNLFELIVEPVVVNIIKDLNAMTFVSREGDCVGFKIVVEIENEEPFVFQNEGALNIYESSISCGIKEAEGVDNLMNFINNFKDRFSDYIDNQNFELSDDFDYEDFIKEIVKSLFQDLIEEFENSCLYLLLSTNIGGNAYYNEAVIDELDSITESVLFGTNPNSGNDISLWALKCN